MNSLRLAIVLISVHATAQSESAGLFLTETDLQRMRNTYQTLDNPALQGSYDAHRVVALGALDEVADPFTMDDIGDIEFHWCSTDTDGVDNSLADAQRDIESQSHSIRSLAFQYALTLEREWADKALELMTRWANEHTPVNIYDFNPNFRNATIDGMTDGFCSSRPWNFALDAMWQTYGLINISDAYLLISRNGYSMTQADRALLRSWIRRMAQAVNASFHAWTKWADHNPNSSSFERYRSDNHLSWSLIGLLAAGVALDDSHLIRYVLEGSAWDDGRSGSYANPSPIVDVIDRAIESNGRIYEERINRDPPIGYSFFHLWPMTLIARIDEIHGDGTIWSHRGSDGGGLRAAFFRYSAYILGTPESGSEGSLTSHAWLYRFADHWWPEEGFATPAGAIPDRQIIRQSGGPVLFMFSELFPSKSPPEPPILIVQ